MPVTTPPLNRAALKTVTLYVVISSIWLLLSDWLLESLALAPAWHIRLLTLKEWPFLAASALFLYWLMGRHYAAMAQERQQSEDKLRTQLTQMSTVFDAINAVIYVCEMDSDRIIYLNGFGETLFGTDWQGQICHDFIYQEPNRLCETCHRGELVIDGIPQPPRTTEFRSSVNGRWHQRIDRAIRWTDGRLVRMELLLDINEQRELERMKDDMISAVSHEMQTPLTAMLGFTEFLLDHPDLPETERISCLETVNRETSRLNELIGAFLDLQRMQAQAMTYQFESLDLGPLLDEAAHLYGGASQSHRISLELAKELPPVRGDLGRIAQVFGNLLSNAVKYSPQGGTVQIIAGPVGDCVEVRVRDQGLGIPDEDRDKIFERFHRVDNSDRRRIGGTGIGLAVVKEIVTAHGGTIRVESIHGVGSDFIVTLPVAHDTQPPPP